MRALPGAGNTGRSINDDGGMSMNKEFETIDLVESTDFLLSELRKEWSRSKENKASIVISRKAARELLWMVTGRGILIGQEAKGKNLSFRDDILATRECHIYLRLAEKIHNALFHTVKATDNVGVNLDAEEYDCLYPLLKARGEDISGGEV